MCYLDVLISLKLGSPVVSDQLTFKTSTYSHLNHPPITLWAKFENDLDLIDPGRTHEPADLD